MIERLRLVAVLMWLVMGALLLLQCSGAVPADDMVFYDNAMNIWFILCVCITLPPVLAKALDAIFR